MLVDWDLILDPFYSGTGVSLSVEECQAIRALIRAQQAVVEAAYDAQCESTTGIITMELYEALAAVRGEDES